MKPLPQPGTIRVSDGAFEGAVDRSDLLQFHLPCPQLALNLDVTLVQSPVRPGRMLKLPEIFLDLRGNT